MEEQRKAGRLGAFPRDQHFGGRTALPTAPRGDPPPTPRKGGRAFRTPQARGSCVCTAATCSRSCGPDRETAFARLDHRFRDPAAENQQVALDAVQFGDSGQASPGREPGGLEKRQRRRIVREHESEDRPDAQSRRRRDGVLPAEPSRLRVAGPRDRCRRRSRRSRRRPDDRRTTVATAIPARRSVVIVRKTHSGRRTGSNSANQARRAATVTGSVSAVAMRPGNRRVVDGDDSWQIRGLRNDLWSRWGICNDFRATYCNNAVGTVAERARRGYTSFNVGSAEPAAFPSGGASSEGVQHESAQWTKCCSYPWRSPRTIA